MTKPWPEIIARYDDHKGAERSIRTLGTLARRIGESPLATGLFAWTSMFDLCIVQTEVTHPYDGPFLRLSPNSEDQIELRYVDTLNKGKQWHRTVDAEHAFARLIKFLDELRWFPSEVIERLRDTKG